MSSDRKSDKRIFQYPGVLTLLALSFGAPLPAAETAASRPRIEIAAGPAGQALKQFVAQTGLQLLFDYEAVNRLSTQPVSGQLDAAEALKRMLAGTGLAFEFVNDRTVTITMAGAGRRGPGGAGNKTSSAGERAENVLLARADGDPKTDSSDVEEMLVEGERDKPAPFSTANIDLTRTEDDVLPFTTFTARDIELSGTSNLQEFLLNRLPQNFSADVPDEVDGQGSIFGERTERVNMRGWGDAESIFLLNGRRMPSEYYSYTGGDLTSNATPNLRAIPMGSIERIEILTSAGSAIYGGRATGGVINIITVRDFRGGQMALNYESPADVHRPRRNADLSYGLPLGRSTSLMLSASLSESQPLHAGDRADVTTLRWRERVMQVQPSLLVGRTVNPPLGSTPNIRTVSIESDANLFGPGTSNFATVPDGYAGGSGTGAFRQGVYNLGMAEGVSGSNFLARDSTLGLMTRSSVLGFEISRTLRQDWRLSFNYRHARSDSEGQVRTEQRFTIDPVFEIDSNTAIPASAPINPFGRDVGVAFIDPRLARPELDNSPRNTTDTLGVNLAGRWRAWRGFADLTFTHNANQFTDEIFYHPPGGWLNAFITGTYNPFVDARSVAPALPEFYENYIALREGGRSATRSYLASFKSSGPLFNTRAGAAQLTFGLEWAQSNRYKGYRYGQFQDGITGEPRIPFNADSDISLDDEARRPDRKFITDSYAVYAETTVPLLGERQRVPFVAGLELFTSGRIGREVRDGFKTDGTPIHYTSDPYVYAFGFRHDVIEGVGLRASRSIGFKPPGLASVAPGNPPTVNITVNDRRRNDPQRRLTPTQYVTGGNPELKPETTSSSNFGLILAPQWLPGTRISLDYLHSVRDDAIASITAQLVLDLENELPDRVQRGAPDGNASGVGPITFLDYRNINFRQIVSRSMDFNVDQQLRSLFGGQLVFSAAASWNLSFRTQTTNTTPAAERVRSTTTSFAQQIEWNANGQLRWEGRQWSVGWAARYFDYVLSNPADLLLQGGDRVPWRVNHDVNLSYRTPAMSQPRGLQMLRSGISITFGIKNLFDREPRFWAASSDRGVAPYDSIMGRSIWLQMRKSFE